MRNLLSAAAFLLATSVAPDAVTASPILHSDPAPGDNLRIYTILGAGTAILTLDGGPSAIDAMSVMFAQVSPGTQSATLRLPDGSQTSLDFTLSSEALIESKGRRWWCLSTGRRGGQLTMLALTPAQCRSLAAQGPD